MKNSYTKNTLIPNDCIIEECFVVNSGDGVLKFWWNLKRLRKKTEVCDYFVNIIEGKKRRKIKNEIKISGFMAFSVCGHHHPKLDMTCLSIRLIFINCCCSWPIDLHLICLLGSYLTLIPYIAVFTYNNSMLKTIMYQRSIIFLSFQ